MPVRVRDMYAFGVRVCVCVKLLRVLIPHTAVLCALFVVVLYLTRMRFVSRGSHIRAQQRARRASIIITVCGADICNLCPPSPPPPATCPQTDARATTDGQFGAGDMFTDMRYEAVMLGVV